MLTSDNDTILLSEASTTEVLNMLLSVPAHSTIVTISILNVNVIKNTIYFIYDVLNNNNITSSTILYAIPIDKICIVHIAKEYLLNSPLWTYNVELVKNTRRSNRLHDTYEATMKFNLNANFISDFKTSTGLLMTLLKCYKNANLKTFNLTSSIPSTATLNLVSPNVTLFQYQQNNINKMINIEDNSLQYKIKYTSEFIVNDETIIFDPIQELLCENHKYFNISSKGGILADDMGLGKTITCIGLCLLKQLSNSTPLDGYIQSKASLIICLSHLATQWKNEIQRCSPTSKIVFIESKKSFEKYSVNDLANANFIIITCQFLTNFNYYPKIYYEHRTPSNINISDRHRKVREHYNSIVSSNSEEKQYPILDLFHFERLIVDESHQIYNSADFSSSMKKYIRSTIDTISSTYRWAVSGTPFTDLETFCLTMKLIDAKIKFDNLDISFENILDMMYKSSSAILNNLGAVTLTNHSQLNNSIYLQYFTDSVHQSAKEFILKCMNKSHVIDFILYNIYIKHTKDDINNQINIPEYVEVIKWVTLSQFEYGIYATAKRKRASVENLQKLCSHLLLYDSNRRVVGNCEKKLANIDEIRDKLILYHQTNIITYENKLLQLDSSKPEYHMVRKNYESQIAESKYFCDVILQTSHDDIQEQCIICLDTVKSATVSKNCRHIFCKSCIIEWLQRTKTCPSCKRPMTETNLILLSKVVEPIANKLNHLIDKYGTKLGSLINLIIEVCENPDSRIIVFSQWDDMLSIISVTLEVNGIKNSFVKGTIWARDKAIHKFKEGLESKVIMLSLKNKAAGANLSEATHIIFLEPINANPEHVKSIEMQAIGRACRIGCKNNVQIIRFLTRNTVEEDIYNSVYINNSTPASSSS